MDSNMSQKGFLRLNQVLELLPIGKSTFWAGIKSGRFPKPVKLGVRTSAWRREDIYALLEKFSKGEQ